MVYAECPKCGWVVGFYDGEYLNCGECHSIVGYEVDTGQNNITGLKE